MAKINGGIIGPNNPTGPFSAGGVWRLEDAFNAQKAGTWPVVLGYQIPNSLRFNSGSSDYLNRTPASASNRRTWTWSAWVKRTALDSQSNGQVLFDTQGSDSNTNFIFQFDDGSGTGGADTCLGLHSFGGDVFTTNSLYRDISAWYHVILAIDTTQATTANRIRLYVNGSEVTLNQGVNFPTQNFEFGINTTQNHAIGRHLGFSDYYLDGYLAEVNFVDGQQLTPSSFGQTDSTTGIWTPIAYTGTYGTNGFYLNFANSADLGNDVSGNNNDWTVNNLTSIDQSYDSPTNNFATGNPLLYRPTYGWATLSEGNLKHSSAGLTTSWGGMMSNIIPSSGKWYAEVYCQGNAAGIIGVANAGTLNVDYFMVQNPQLRTGFWGISYNAGGSRIQNGSDIVDANVTNFMSNGIVGIALDCSNKTLTMYIDGSVISTVNGLNIINTAATDAFAFMSLTADGTASVFNWNFGYPPFTISSGNADANGFGNFEYAVPSGYYALCSKNLALYG